MEQGTVIHSSWFMFLTPLFWHEGFNTTVAEIVYGQYLCLPYIRLASNFKPITRYSNNLIYVLRPVLATSRSNNSTHVPTPLFVRTDAVRKSLQPPLWGFFLGFWIVRENILKFLNNWKRTKSHKTMRCILITVTKSCVCVRICSFVRQFYYWSLIIVVYMQILTVYTSLYAWF